MLSATDAPDDAFVLCAATCVVNVRGLQMETAALKKAGDNRNKVFERKVTAIYTPATLEAGASEDVGESDNATANATQAVASSFLMALSEGVPGRDAGVPCDGAVVPFERF